MMDIGQPVEASFHSQAIFLALPSPVYHPGQYDRAKVGRAIDPFLICASTELDPSPLSALHGTKQTCPLA